MSLPPEIAETSRLLAQDSTSRQHAASLKEYLEEQGLTLEPGLLVSPKEKVTPEITKVIQTHRPALISAVNAPLKELSDSRRYLAEHMRAIDMRRQGKACCNVCLYFKPTIPTRERGLCLHIQAITTYEQTRDHKDYCSEFLPLKP